MSDNTHAVADYASETYPEFSGKIQDTYIKATIQYPSVLLTLPFCAPPPGWAWV